jgi:hypothetical protein
MENKNRCKPVYQNNRFILDNSHHFSNPNQQTIPLKLLKQLKLPFFTTPSKLFMFVFCYIKQEKYGII